MLLPALLAVSSAVCQQKSSTDLPAAARLVTPGNPTQENNIPLLQPSEAPRSAPSCTFISVDELEQYLQREIQAQLPAVMARYNRLFGTTHSPSEVIIKYGVNKPNPAVSSNYNIMIPRFYHDFEQHMLHLDFRPPDNPEAFLRKLCSHEALAGEWELFKALTIGFLPHELGHWYHDGFMRRKGIKVRFTDDNKSPEGVGFALVREGVATYLETLIDPTETHEGTEEYKDAFEQVMTGRYWNRYGYPAGEKLVRPILETEFLKGLELISRTLPKPRKAEDLTRYQQRILAQL